MPAGDITRTVAHQLPALLPARVDIVRGVSVSVYLQDGNEIRHVFARNGVCRGWNDSTNDAFTIDVANGYTAAFLAFRTNGFTGLINRLITDGILVVVGTIE